MSTVAINLDDKNNNPIVIGIGLNPIMLCWEVELVVGNIKTEEEAKQIGEKLQRLVEKKLGSRRSSLAKGH